MSRGQGVLLGCGVLVLVFLCGALLFSGGASALFFLRNQGLDFSLSGRVDPSPVYTRESLRVLLTVHNESDQSLAITQVHFPKDILAGLDFQEVVPADLGRGSDGEFLFDLQLPPGSSETFLFEFESRFPGDYSGEVAVQVGNQVQKINLRMVVLDVVALASSTPLPSPTQTSTPVPTLTPLPSFGSVPYPAVVQIFAMVGDDEELQIGWSGSGTIIAPDGLILTNAHVVLSDKYYRIIEIRVGLTLNDDRPPDVRYLAEVLQADPALDIAVIQIISDLDGNPVDQEVLNLPHVPIGDSDSLSLGDSISILGYPGIGGETITLTRGEVSGFTSNLEPGERAFIKTSATIAGGNSGGLAVNQQGELIGVPTQLGYGGNNDFVDCRVLADTNRDGIVDENDNCVPTGGFINALRPVKLAIPLIEAAQRGETLIGSQFTLEQQIPMTDQVLFEDDFSDPQSGWDTGGDSSHLRSYVAGEYHIEITPPNFFAWGNPGTNLQDVILSVEVRPIRSTGKGDFGLLCRYMDERNFYALEISEDGYYSIWKAENGEFHHLVPWSYSSQIPDEEVFNVTAACIEDTLSLAVDGILLAEVSDQAHTSGDVGLIAGTWEDGNLTMAYDNLIVRSP